jgi:hypothetical protein
MAGTTTYFGISYPQSTDLVKDGAANMQTIATGFDSAVAIPTYNNQTGTTYTFALSDIGKTVTASNAGASTYTIPPTASVTWPANTTLDVVNLGAGVVTFAAGAGVTVTNTAATLGQYQTAQLVRTGLNAWTVVPSGSSAVETVLSSGNFTGVSAVNLSNVLSSTYKYYNLKVFGYVSSAAQDMFIRFRENTTDKATGYYGGRFRVNYLATTQAAGYNNSSAFYVTTFYTNPVSQGNITATIYRPSATEGIVSGLSFDSDASGPVMFAGQCTTMTNFTGLSFYPTGATTTGSYILTGIK